MGVAKIEGTLDVGPASVCDSEFPGGDSTANLTLTPASKVANVATGIPRMTLNSPGAYVALSGIGALGPVTQANLLYLRSEQAIWVRLTFENGSDADVVSELPVQGLLIIEVESARYIKLLEAKGSGKIEWCASGVQ